MSKPELISIKKFLERYKDKIDVTTPEAVGYHMKKDYIDWEQPSRDRFVKLTAKTLKFYGL